MAGGGGGAGSSATLAPFVKFSSIAVPSTIQINGSSQQVDYTYDTSTNRVTSLSAVTPFTSGASYLGTYDANGDTTKAVLTSATGTSITVDTANGGQFIDTGNFTWSQPVNNQSFVLSANPQSYGWDYQTFGVWATGEGTGSGTVGAASIGAETAGSAIPVSGIATFKGVSGGQYVDITGGSTGPSSTITRSDMTATADFGARTIAFATTNTGNFFSPTSANMPDLDMSGTLSYSAGVNKFMGAVSTVGGASNAAMSGNATGKFYGPTAQEIGGTFAVSNSGAGYLGAFGGKR